MNKFKSDLSDIKDGVGLVDLPSVESTDKINSFLLKYYIENEMEKVIKQKQAEVTPHKEIPDEIEEDSNLLEQAIDQMMSNSSNYSKSHLSFSKQQKSRAVLWEHKNRKHYAKGLWSLCYRKAGRTKLAWKCEHKTKPLYALGWCQTCYLSIYYNSKAKGKQEDNNS